MKHPVLNHPVETLRGQQIQVSSQKRRRETSVTSSSLPVNRVTVENFEMKHSNCDMLNLGGT